MRPVPRCRSTTAILARSRSGSATTCPSSTVGSSIERLGQDLIGDHPDHARLAALPGNREVAGGDVPHAHRVLDPLGHLHALDLAERKAALEHGVRHEALEVGQQEQVGLIAGCDRAQVREAVPGGRVEGRHHERILGRDPGGDGVAHHRVDVAVLGDVLGLAVVGAEGDPAGAVLPGKRKQGVQVPRSRGLADQEPHPCAQPLSALLDRERLVVGTDPGRGVGVQRPARHAGRVPVHVLGSGQCELGQLVRVAGDDAGKVHHLGEADHPAPAQQALEIAGRERSPRRLELRRGHARGGHEVDVQWKRPADVEQPVDAVGAEHVGDLVRIDDDGGRAERQHEPRELVHEQLRRLEVHVRVDEAGHDETAGGVQRLGALVVAEPCDVAVDDRDVGLEPLAGEHREDAAAADDEIGRLVPPCNRQPSGEIGHPRDDTLARAWTS